VHIFQNVLPPPQTLHVGNQQVALGLMIDPVLESTTFLPGLRVASHQVDLFAVLHRILDEVSDQLLLQRGVRDVVGGTVNQVDGNDPGGSRKQKGLELWVSHVVLKHHEGRGVVYNPPCAFHSLWDLSEGLDGLGRGGVPLDVLSCCVLDVALLQSRGSITTHLLSVLEDLSHNHKGRHIFHSNAFEGSRNKRHLMTGMSICTDCKALWGKFVICENGHTK